MLRGTSAPAVRVAARLPTGFRRHLFFEGGRTRFYLGLVGSKRPGCRLRRPQAGHSRLRGCTEWLWHLLEVGPHRTTPRSCSGRIGRAPGPPRSPGPSFTLRVFVNRCVGLLPPGGSISFDTAEKKRIKNSVCVCVCVWVWCLRYGT
mgnify:CR=1 FL=1